MVHKNINRLVLNVAQMHNHELICQFHSEPQPLNRDFAFQSGAAREVAAQRARKAAQSPDSNEAQSLLQSVLNPLNTGTGGRGRGRGRGQGSALVTE